MLGWVTWQAEPWNDSPNGVCQGPSTQEEIFADITVRQAFKHPLRDVLLPTRQVWSLTPLNRTDQVLPKAGSKSVRPPWRQSSATDRPPTNDLGRWPRVARL